jgi:vWA-MoxR associated protein C-terminal domain/Caspase domain
MRARAVIVGIERYALEKWNVDAPALNAISIAKWALSAGISPDDIFLFLSALDDTVTEELVGAGVKVRSATFSEIDTFLQTDLAIPQGGSDLILYWSGHGMTDTAGHRLLFYATYTPQLPNHVFNASLFVRDLRGDAFTCFQRALILADVCGMYSDTPVRPAVYLPGPQYQSRQLTYFATPEGGYAIADTGEGAFTNSALQVLRKFNSFPDLDGFQGHLDRILKASESTRYRIYYQSDQEEGEVYVGRGRSSDDPLADGLIELLIKLAPSNDLLDRHFRATAVTIGNPRLLSAQGVTGMVRELNALQDEIEGPTHGLIQFLLRLCSERQLEVELSKWLSHNAKLFAVNNEKARLATESGRKLLILDLEVDIQGNLTGFRPLLRYRDFSLVPAKLEGHKPVSKWSELEAALKTLLADLESQGLAGDLEIHIIAGPEVFNRPFHLLAGLNPPKKKKKRRLGEQFGVVLHHRERFRRPLSAEWRRWQKKAKALEGMEPKSLAWTCFRPNEDLPSTPTLCLAGFAVVTGPAGEDGIETLRRLLELGAPYVYWPHDPAENDSEVMLAELLKQLNTLADMPEALWERRIAEAQIRSGSLLWDGLAFQPYNHLRGFP